MAVRFVCFVTHASFALLVACESKLEPIVVGSRAPTEDSADAKFEVTGRSPLVVSLGSSVALVGRNFRPSMRLAAIGLKGISTNVNVKVESDSKASIELFERDLFGPVALTLDQDGETQRISVFFDGGKTDFPIITRSDAEVCKGERFYNASGSLREGTRTCNQGENWPICSSDGESDCVANTNFPAVDKTAKLMPGNIKVGVKIAGVSGTIVPRPLACVADGVTGCVTSADFPSVEKARIAPDNVKIGVIVAGITGALIPTPANCLEDGGVSCVSTKEFKAAKLGNYTDGDVRAGITIAGVTGSLAGAPASCGADGAIGCLSNASFKAADMTRVTSGNVRSQVTIAGVVGSVIPTPGECSTDGGTDCVTNARYKSADTDAFGPSNITSGKTVAGIVGSLGSCAADGATNCVAVTTYPAANLANFSPEDVRFNTTIAGVTGSLADCGADGATSCVAVPGFKAADMAVATPGNIKSGATLAGVAGSVTPSPVNCAADGATGCVAYAAFKAADMTNVTAGSIKSGVTIAGVTGSYPSTTHKLPGATATSDLVSLASETATGVYEWWGPDGTRYSGTIGDVGTITPGQTDQSFNTSVYRQFTVAGDADLVAGNIKDGVTLFGVEGGFPSSMHPLAGADTTPDLDFATFDAKIKGAASFEWFDPSGTRYTNTGDPEISAPNIASGVTIFNTTGALFGGVSSCTSDGETGCVTTNTYKSVDTSALSTWDLRWGKNAGGIIGTLTFYKNMANTAIFDRTSGAGSITGLDVFDTIDDFNNGGTFPTQNPNGWAQATGANWIRDSASDDGAGGGAAADGFCNGTEDCVYRDQITEMSWAKDDGVMRSWETAITDCASLIYGTHSDWRLPTQKELMQAYASGVWSQNGGLKLNLSPSSYWSSSTLSGNAVAAWSTYLVTAETHYFAKTQSKSTICVRP